MSETTSGVAELIGRLKKDGVDAGEAEKRRIVDDAEKRAEAIVADAKKKAEDLLLAAKQERDRLKHQLDAELSMAARDFVLRLEGRIKAQVVNPVVSDVVKGVLEDTTFLKATLKDLVLKFAERGADVELTMSPETRAKLDGFFTGELKSALGSREITLVDEAGVVGFRIEKKGESFAWDFTKEAVARELVRLVDPALRAYFAFDDAPKTRAPAKNGQHASA